ncbi:MAG: aminotransferase class I/II-fold pyridoxal phosphate-dependent enzyme, partial [Firmicutes bacterium]|nr:aminotransferase class I/II-fold pyridoxal phosphate-dependent enzyme [Bacillota bacterium]
DIQSQVTSNVNTIAQYAAIEALEGDQSSITVMREEFDRRRQYIVGALNTMPGLSVAVPHGAFYVWVDMSGLIGKNMAGRIIRDADDLAMIWLENEKVAVVPGSGFGMPQYFRLSYAVAMERLEEGVRRIAHSLEVI